jgi:hypothetical protein
MDKSHPSGRMPRLAFQSAARDAGLHIFGAASATILLTFCLGVTKEFLPSRSSTPAADAAVPAEGAASATQRAFSPSAVRPDRKIVRLVRNSRWRSPTPLAVFRMPARPFVPPAHYYAVPVPQFVDAAFAPEIAAIVQAVIAPFPEFSLPPRPRPGAVRVILAVVSPFRRLARWLGHANDSAVLGD